MKTVLFVSVLIAAMTGLLTKGYCKNARWMDITEEQEMALDKVAGAFLIVALLSTAVAFVSLLWVLIF